jgi:RimJ/RimL family protein N-acetyltransferase
MGVDLNKLPSAQEMTQMLSNQISLPYTEKPSFALIATFNGQAIGHCNVNDITFGQEATMHLHLWNTSDRKNGWGTAMVRQSLAIFYEKLQLQTIWCEPYAANPAPNRTLARVGFEFVKKYVTTPGSLSFEQEVNRYRMTRVLFEKILRNAM